MRKNLFAMFAMAVSALVATSCSNQFEDVQAGGEATVTLTAQLPDGIQNHVNGPRRAAAKYGDGKTATTLDYAVYQVAADGAWTLMNDLSKTDEAINLSTTVKLQLVNGNTYAVVFWADAPTSIYTFDTGAMTVTADYDAAATDNEEYDAFYAVKTFTVNGASQETVELKRPFAQLNIGTADLAASEAAGVEVTKAGVKVNTYKTLNLKTGEVADPADVEFALAALPTGETFPVSGYEYLTMNYLLMPADKKADNTITISYDNTAAGTRTFNNVPLQRNYRTNIYGNLLTGTAEFNVVITPDFDGEALVWDGTSKMEPQTDATTGAYLITRADEWAWLGGKNIQKSITIMNDIDFGGHSVQCFALGLKSAGTPGTLVVDGQGHTLSNLSTTPYIDPTKGTDYVNGLIAGGWYVTYTVKDLTVKDIKVDCPNVNNGNGADIHGFAGAVIGEANAKANLAMENVKVINANVKGIQSVGGLVGFVTNNATLTLTNCSVENSAISNYPITDESGFVCGLVGRVVGTATITDCSVSNTTVDAFYAPTDKRGVNSIAEIYATDLARFPTASITLLRTDPTNVTVTKTSLADVFTVASTEELKSALAAGKGIIKLAAGTYELGGVTFGDATRSYVLMGESKANVIVKMQKSLYIESAHTLTLKDLTLNIPTGLTYNEFDFGFFQRGAGLTVSNCSVQGCLRVNGENTLVEDCDFTVTTSDGFDGYAIYYYGSTGSKMTVNNCTFNVVKKGIVMYAERACVYNLDVNNCVFTASTTDDKCAIQMHTEYGISGTLNIKNTTATGFKDLHNGLWQDVNNNTKVQTQKFTVTVDGTTVQTA